MLEGILAAASHQPEGSHRALELLNAVQIVRLAV